MDKKALRKFRRAFSLYYPEHFDNRYKIKIIIATVPNVPEPKQPQPSPESLDVLLKAWKSSIFPPLPLFQSIKITFLSYISKLFPSFASMARAKNIPFLIAEKYLVWSYSFEKCFSICSRDSLSWSITENSCLHL